MPNFVQNIEESAFVGAGFTSIVLPKGLKVLEPYVFSGCDKLTSISLILNDGLTTIGNDVFNGCKNIKSINIGDKIEYIGNGALSGLGLTELHLGENVATIGAIGKLEKLTTITVDSQNKNYMAKDNVLYRDYTDFRKTVIFYAQANTKNDLVIDNGTSYIEEDAIVSDNITYLTLSSKNLDVRENAIKASNLTSLILNSENLNLDENAIIAQNLTTLIINANGIRLSENSISCKNLSELILNTGVISDSAILFAKDWGAKTVYVKSGITLISESDEVLKDLFNKESVSDKAGYDKYVVKI